MGSPVYNYDTAPNGEQEATRIVSNGGSYPQIVETITGLTVGQEYTASFYVKSDGTSQIQQSTHVTGVGSTVNFTPTNEWQRISVIITATATTHNFVIFTSNSSAPASSYLIWGPQFEEGTTASDFVENTTGSAKFITGATFGPRVPMILVEPSATNLITYSEDFNTVNGSTKTTGIVAPDGSNNAERFSGGALINNVFANSKTASIATGSAVDYVGSIYVRGTAGETVTVFMKRAGAGPIVSSGSLSVLLTGQWQRVENLSLTTDPANDGLRIFISSSSETADSVDLWGAQVETGSVSTSYIPTSGSTAQRAADNLEITGSAFTDFYNGSEGTFYVEVVDRQVTGSSHSYIVGQSASQFFLYKDSGSAQITSFDAGTGMNKSPLVANQLMRLALTYKSASPASRSLSLDGSTSDGSYNGNFSSANILKIGGGYSDVFSGYFRRILFWPYHSDNL
jgi:hypothetical protein